MYFLRGPIPQKDMLYYYVFIKNVENKLKSTDNTESGKDCTKTYKDTSFAREIKYAYRLTAENENQ